MRKTASKITQLFALVTITSLFGCGEGVETKTDSSKVDPTQPVSDWKMVWNDEFDGTAIDDKNWTHEVNCDGGGNNEKQCYTDSADNAYVEDGILQIVALPAEEGADQPYTSARLITQYKADFKYGRFEVRAKLPSGQGSWPAFWMMPTDSVYGGWPHSGEIDILEAVNLKAVDADGNVEGDVHGTLHYGKEWPNNSHSGKAYTLPDNINPADDFHTYAIEWQEGEIRWYVDGYLFQTQRKSTVRYNSKDEAVGLSHRGWFTENYDIVTGELTTQWENAPFDQEFFMILNFAVGGDWPENVNNLGVDASAFTDGQRFEIDYVRAYECQINPDTGAGCETVRGNYDSLDDALVEGKAPIPIPPSTGIAQNLTIFDGTINPSWPAWDCCGDTTPAVMVDDDKGNVMEFSVGATATVNGFISRAAFIDSESGGAPSPFDASPLISDGTVSFDMKVTSPTNDASAIWYIKMESQEGETAADFALSESIEGLAPVTGEWQTYTFPLQAFDAKGLELSAIDVVMVFPAWGAGEGAVYQITNLTIASDSAGSPSVVLFEDDENASWPMWDCCGATTPMVVIDEDAAHGAVAEFSIGDTATVMGFISRPDNTETPAPFDASAILSNGVIQFDMKVITMPADSSAVWAFKVEANNNETFAAFDLDESVEGLAPVEGQWQTYTFNLADLANAGLDVSAIDVVMMFPSWGAGADAVYRVDNVKIYDPNAASNFSGFVMFDDAPTAQWTIVDCCAGSTPTLENDDTEHGMTAEFAIGSTATVMGLLADKDVYLDASSLLTQGVVQFELKIETPPSDSAAQWLFKIEAGDATSEVQLNLADSDEGAEPVVGQWQTYTYSLQSLFDAGLAIEQIDALLVFPTWGMGEGAVYRLDNVMIYDPTTSK